VPLRIPQAAQLSQPWPITQRRPAESAKWNKKMRAGLKELRETHRWLKLVLRVPLIEPPSQVAELIAECDELIRIFVPSIRTAEKRL